MGIVAETTVGTAATVTRFLDFGQESIKLDIDRIEYQALRPTRRVLGSTNWVAGKTSVSGEIELPVTSKSQGLLWKHALGAVATSTPSGATLTRDHKCTVGALDGLAFTIQVGRTDVGGTTRAFTYSGCKIAGWELSHDVSSMLMAKLTIDGMSEATGTGLASASYATGMLPFAYTNGVIAVAGSSFDVMDWSLKADNKLATDRFFIRSTTPGSKKEQLEGAGIREYDGTVTADFTDLTAYNRFVNGTLASFTATYTSTTAIEGTFFPSFTVTLADIRFDGETPTVGGPELLKQSLPFKVVDSSSTDGPVVITVRNSDSAP